MRSSRTVCCKICCAQIWSSRGQAFAAGRDLPTDRPPISGSLSFAADIEGLFRDFDRDSMLGFSLDLHKYEDTRNWADDILAKVASGEMPCDAAGRWPPERVARFQQWITHSK